MLCLKESDTYISAEVQTGSQIIFLVYKARLLNYAKTIRL